MEVSAVMTRNVHTCGSFDTLADVARVMWEEDVGAMPVVDEHGTTIGMITDRDVAMAAYTQGKPLSEIPVWIAASNKLIAARPEESIELVHERMRSERIRRMPVIDEEGMLLGMLSLSDLTWHYITQPRVKAIEGAVYRVRSSDGAWDVFDRMGVRVAKGLRTQGDAVMYARERAVRDGSAEIVVYDDEDNVVSERFYRTDEHSAMATEETAIPTLHS
jgi:CBS domain-containing protein